MWKMNEQQCLLSLCRNQRRGLSEVFRILLLLRRVKLKYLKEMLSQVSSVDSCIHIFCLVSSVRQYISDILSSSTQYTVELIVSALLSWLWWLCLCIGVLTGMKGAKTPTPIATPKQQAQFQSGKKDKKSASENVIPLCLCFVLLTVEPTKQSVVLNCVALFW